MKIVHTFLAAMFLAACVLTGCQSPKAMPPVGSGASTRNNGYSLLHQLLAEQKDVSMLRFIKPEHADVKKLVKQIAATSGAGAALLEKFAADDPTINLNDIRLPPGEVATRDAIASTKEKELLGQTGDRFELTLLLTQTEALSYAWHLAEITAKNEPQPDRARALAGIGADMDNLYHQVFALLLSKNQSSATNSMATNPISSQTAPLSTNTSLDFQTLIIDPSSMPVDAGTATLIIGALHRADGVYSGNYQIKVFPYFLKNENGTLAIVVSDESLAEVNHGKVAAITGTATTSGKDGLSRHIEATATPADINRGNLKLWFMAGGRKMTFKPAYHFAGKNQTGFWRRRLQSSLEQNSSFAGAGDCPSPVPADTLSLRERDRVRE
jgi:hypothetical protein